MPAGRHGRYGSIRPPVYHLGAVLVASALLAAGAPAGASARSGADTAAETRRLAVRAFGTTGEIDLETAPGAGEADAALEAAAGRLRATEDLLAGVVERLNRDAREEREVELADDEVVELLARALSHCLWSRGAISPLAVPAPFRSGAGAEDGAPPPPPAPCQGLDLSARPQVRMAAGARVDLDLFAPGFAVDRAIGELHARGVETARVRLGRLVRAVGRRADGGGWPELLPVFEGYRRPLDEIRLEDRALAVVWRADWAPGEARFVDRRSGAPPGTVWATAAVAELAVDARAVAVAALVMGEREGRFRIANLRPVPAVLWLLGTGQGRPLLSSLGWSRLPAP